MKIRNNNDLYIAYSILKICKDVEPNRYFEAKAIIDLKREMRAYCKRSNDRTIFNASIDGYTIKQKIPDNVNVNNLNEWFMDIEYIATPKSCYDCTGKPFTGWYRFFKLHNEWYLYHRILFDV